MFNYFGSKARLAPTYQPPKYDLIVEPFAGAAGYSMYWLQQRSDLRCLLLDSNPLVVEMWETLLSMEPTDLWNYPIPPTGLSKDLVYLAAAVGSSEFRVRATRGDFTITPWAVQAFPGRRQLMAQTLSAVRGRVEVAQADYRNAPDAEAAWFIDPPYQLDGQWYAHNQTGLDFPALGEWCRSRRGQVIVCESIGADWMDFTPHCSNSTMAQTTSIEVVWYSHPEPTLLDLMAVPDTIT